MNEILAPRFTPADATRYVSRWRPPLPAVVHTLHTFYTVIVVVRRSSPLKQEAVRPIMKVVNLKFMEELPG
jgi:hypothetical protein